MEKMMPASRVPETYKTTPEVMEENLIQSNGPDNHDVPKIQLPFISIAERILGAEIIPELENLSREQEKALYDIALCKTPQAGYSIWQCEECGHQTYNYNKCKNRNCPICQNLKGQVWADNRSAEVIDAPYFHVVMTLPHELNPLIKENQKLLYGLLHTTFAETLIELARDTHYLGGTPGIIQVLHTWDQSLNYHVHCHAIVTGAGLTQNDELVFCKNDAFFVPVKTLSDLFRGKYLYSLKKMYEDGDLKLEGLAKKYRNRYEWNELINHLYKTRFVSYIKETFNGKGNAIQYLGRYANKIAIGNSRILSATSMNVTFTCRGKDGKQSERMTLSCEEFVRRYLQHVLPSGFQKVRYYGFLSNSNRKEKLDHIFNDIQKRSPFSHRYKEPTESEVLRVEYGIDVKKCPSCKQCNTMKPIANYIGGLSYTYIPKGITKDIWKQEYLSTATVYLYPD